MGAHADGFLMQHVIVEPREDHRDHVRRGRLGPDNQLKAVEGAEPNVGDEHVNKAGLEPFLRHLKIVEWLHNKPGACQQILEQPEDAGVIINDNGDATGGGRCFDFGQRHLDEANVYGIALRMPGAKISCFAKSARSDSITMHEKQLLGVDFGDKSLYWPRLVAAPSGPFLVEEDHSLISFSKGNHEFTTAAAHLCESPRSVIRLQSLSLALALVLIPHAAAATSLGMDLGKDVTSRNVSATFLLTGTTDWVTRTVRASETRWAMNPAVPSRFAEYDPSFHDYSVGLFNAQVDDANVAVKSTNMLTVSGVPGAASRTAWVFNTYASVVRSMPISREAEVLAAGEATASLQVAVWESLLDSSSDLLSGTFRVNASGNIKASAMSFLSGLYSGGPSGYNVTATSWLGAEEGQAEVYLPGVPEPGTLILLSIGIAGAIAVRRRRKT